MKLFAFAVRMIAIYDIILAPAEIGPVLHSISGTRRNCPFLSVVRSITSYTMRMVMVFDSPSESVYAISFHEQGKT